MCLWENLITNEHRVTAEWLTRLVDRFAMTLSTQAQRLSVSVYH